MSFASTDFGPKGQGLPGNTVPCASGHANSKDAKFCSTCGVGMPTFAPYERIGASVMEPVQQCTSGHISRSTATRCDTPGCQSVLLTGKEAEDAQSRRSDADLE